MNKKVLLRYLVNSCAISSALSLNLFAFSANRITGPTDKNGRCVDNIPDAPTCQGERDYGLKSGCINKEEYDSLVAYNSYPVCDRNNTLRAWCSCGCFQKDTKIYSIGRNINFRGYESISKIIENKDQYRVIGLTQGSTMSFMMTNSYKLFNTTSGPETEPLVVFYTENNQRLAVTKKHAILLSDGKMVEAEKVKLTDKLVQADGRSVSLTKIDHEKTNDNVLNILTDGKTPVEHTLFAEGLVVGDLAWQNNLKNMLNSIAVRK